MARAVREKGAFLKAAFSSALRTISLSLLLGCGVVTVMAPSMVPSMAYAQSALSAPSDLSTQSALSNEPAAPQEQGARQDAGDGDAAARLSIKIQRRFVQRLQSDPFSALVTRSAEQAPARRVGVRVERYVIASDNRAFLFEDRGREARVKFLCQEDDPRFDCVFDPQRPGEEIHSLRATTAPRGDVIFKDVTGRVFLRLSSYGGATVFWPGDDEGHAASKSFGDETSLSLPFATKTIAMGLAQRASAHISAIVGAPVIFEVLEPAPTSTNGASVLADAIARSAKGMRMVAKDKDGALALANRIHTVRLIAAEAAELSLAGSVLEVRYNPESDLAGRPASVAVARFLEVTL